jgi:hypothetical protein
LAPAGLRSQNLLINGGFNKPAVGVAPGMPVSATECNFPGGESAAANWTVYINGCGTVTTTLVPSTAPNGGAYMIHVTATDSNAGIVQYGFANQASTLTSVWVYINSGCVMIGTGDSGSTGLDEATCELGRWFHFSRVPNGDSPANEIIVYSLLGASDFYVDNASVVAGS